MTNLWTLRGLCHLLPQKVLMATITVLYESLRLSIPFLTGILVDVLIGKLDVAWGIWGCAALLLAVECAVVMVAYIKETIEARAFSVFDRCLFTAYWESVGNIDIDKFLQIPVGKWMGKLSYDVKTVCSSMRQLFGTVVGFCLFWIGSIILIAHKNATAILFLVLSVIVGGIVCFIFIPRIRIASERMRKSMYRFSDMVYGLVKMHPLLVIHKATSRYLSVIRNTAAAAAARERVLSVVAAQNKLAMDSAFWFMRSVVVLFCVSLVVQGRSTIGEMVALIVLVNQLLQGVAAIMQVVPSLETGIEALKEIQKTVSYGGTAKTPLDDVVLSGDRALQEHDLVTCNAVSFSYPDGKSVMKNLSMRLRGGDFCVFLGRNGTGKSTLAKLILAILKPSEGRIVAKEMRVGWIPQDIEMRGESIIDAIRLKDQNISADTVKCALQVCGLEDWVKALPNGIYTHVSSETISGGQLQLLSIARALVRNPDLLVIDEVSNNLDIVMKQKVFETLNKCSKGRTIILVSHDIESIRLANRIFFFGKNDVVELPQGTTEDEIVKLLNQET
ncbi:MAG: ABC transporter ATP-binding protein [Kiritimatiellae bacterium]|nr:ABC transporter ATP-binding protein [Kiritimatiellia bacterium]